MTIKELNMGSRLWAAGKCKTTRELAQKLDMPANTVGQWVRNQNTPRADALAYICKVLNVSADYLLGLTEEE